MEAETAWANEAFEAFANDVLASPLFKAHVVSLVDERTAEIWSELSDAWTVVAELRADLDRSVPTVSPAGAPVPPGPPTRLPPGLPLSFLSSYRRQKESGLFWWRARNAPQLTSLPPIPRLARVGATLTAASLALVLVCPHPGAVADTAPAETFTPVYVPMPGTPEAPLAVHDVAVQPPNDARFPTTTVTR